MESVEKTIPLYRGTASDISKRIGQMIHKPTSNTRSTPAQLRNKIAAAQIEILEQSIEEIRDKIRVTPGWAAGYNSAITTLEIKIALLRNKRTDTQ